MVGATYVIAVWMTGLGLALLFYGTATFCRTGCRILRAWTEPRRRRQRRVRQRHLDLRMHRNRQAAMLRLQAPRPSWLREN